MEEIKKCIKCGGDMEKGNFSGNQVDWQKDNDRSFLQTSGRQITSYSCVKCGYMESYVKR